MSENIEIATIHQIKEKPTKCPKCSNPNLRSDIVKANLGGSNVEHVYCQSCKLLMIINPPPKNLFTQIKKSVGFIFKVDDKERITPYGTGFFVRVPIEGRENKAIGYFVTAKHVLQDNAGNFLSEIFIRLNKLDGSSSYTKVPLTSEQIFTHEDNGVDLAVLPFRPLESIIDFKFIQSELIPKKERIQELGLGEGDDVFFAGLFTSYMGQQKNHPICRFGKVALISDEKIEWKEKGKVSIRVYLYLLECHSFGGNSGSPVFFQLSQQNISSNIEKNPNKIYLAGIMKGSFSSAKEVEIVSKNKDMISWENVGISAVTPAYQLQEILYSDELKKQRQTAEDQKSLMEK